MSGESWLPFRYRDFYDVPRAIVVERAGLLYFFDCPFSDDLDDYPEYYTVYRLPSDVASRADADSWLDLAEEGEPVGRVAVAKVRFDQTRRASISDAVFEILGID